jgi:hypothetical protein
MDAALRPGGFFLPQWSRSSAACCLPLPNPNSLRAESNDCPREACDAALKAVIHVWRLRRCEWLAREWSGEYGTAPKARLRRGSLPRISTLNRRPSSPSGKRRKQVPEAARFVCRACAFQLLRFTILQNTVLATLSATTHSTC